ncbi:hypothetical protein HKX48_000642 [Thoreauomyces humboldtii]|nr:hypothetical protein HKX48_000642 [Thoreauomyces humboldtii]
MQIRGSSTLATVTPASSKDSVAVPTPPPASGPVASVTSPQPAAPSPSSPSAGGGGGGRGSTEFGSHNRPVLTRGFTREGWTRQMTNGGPGGPATPGRFAGFSRGVGVGPGVGHHPSPFFPGHFVQNGSGNNTPGDTLPSQSFWGPASPALAGAFTLEQDNKSPTSAQQSFAFTLHADRSLSHESIPGTPASERGDPTPIPTPIAIPPSVTQTSAKQDVSGSSSTSGRTLMVAVNGSDPDGLATLDWACRTVVQPGDTLNVVRVVRELKGFKGNYAAATEMLSTIETRAREEADRVACHALRRLGKEGKKHVDLYVKYRVGEPTLQIRDLVSAIRPEVLVVGKREVGGKVPGTPMVTASGRNVFFHGGHGPFVPDGLREVVSVVVAQ